jgi:uncharacterized protein YkwD
MVSTARDVRRTAAAVGMIRLRVRILGGLAVSLCGLAMASAGHADALAAANVLREGGCGGLRAAAPPLRHNLLLDRAAALWSAGRAPAAAVERSGYAAEATSALHVTGPDSALVGILRRSACRTLLDPDLRDAGAYRRGSEHWLVLASAHRVPAPADQPKLAARTLQLINDVRARGARCGGRAYGPAPPLTHSATLAAVAQGHAADMAMHGYFEHEDLAGHSPADRVRAVGYREKLVGENIAYGPQSPDEVVRGWLDSPGHCENIMDARFAEMGIAYAPGRAGRRGLYWVQLLAAPRA